MWQAISAIWREANTPDAFAGNPYGALLNQIGHVAVGAFVAALACVAWGAITHEMPVRIAVWIALVVAYMIMIERCAQGWAGRDSLIDTSFIALGAAMPMLALEEISANGRIILELHVKPALAVMAVTVIALAAHVIPRARAT